MGPADRLSIGDVLALLPRLSDWPTATEHRTVRLRGAATILNWLLAHPGEGWQDRWTVSGADHDTTWINTLGPGGIPARRPPSGKSTSPGWPAC